MPCFQLGELQNSVSNTDILFGMVTCHSLVQLEDEEIGDPLDLVMFRSTPWKLVHPSTVSTTQATLPVTRLVQSSNGDALLSIGK